CRVAPPDPGVARISDELFKSFQGAVGLLGYAMQRRNFLPGQSQRPPEKRCKAVYAGKSREGDSQFLTDSNRCLHARFGCGLTRCFRCQQSPGQVSDGWGRRDHLPTLLHGGFRTTVVTSEGDTRPFQLEMQGFV